ncbi:MAG: flagellar export protein FliJ [Planctomycetes bacterium]|nr:flagellar export protein FliJ [Planctomycetota bacterium]
MAKRFQFRLEPVLKHRSRVEEDRLLEFAHEQGRVVEQQRYLNNLAEEKHFEQDEIIRIHDEHGDFTSMLECHRYINTLNLRSAYGRVELSRWEMAMEKRREALLEARKKKRAVELLKEHQQEDHRKAMESEEAKYLDELAIKKFRAPEHD